MEMHDYIVLRNEGNSVYYWLEPQKQLVCLSYYPDKETRLDIAVYPLDSTDLVFQEVTALINDGWRIDDAEGIFKEYATSREIVI